jgi:2-polyprenyl-3-methyl-5-hydroxy-6-metoxy-1,4-benzoquinol methylase
LIKTKCKVCGNDLVPYDQTIVLDKYNVQYFSCPGCGFIQTEEPYWLDEAYAQAITIYDTGILARNFANAVNVTFFLNNINMKDCKSLDFGGGHGVFTRIMRDYGFNFFHYDKYAENLFAGGFDGNLNEEYDLVTSFENFEHFVNPMSEIKNLIDISDILFFSTLLIPSYRPPPPIVEWWYFCPSAGQHVAFYTRNTLEYIAKQFKLHFISNYSDMHIFSKHKINPYFFKSLNRFNMVRNKLDFFRFFKQKSRVWDDFQLLINKNIEGER